MKNSSPGAIQTQANTKIGRAGKAEETIDPDFGRRIGAAAAQPKHRPKIAAIEKSRATELVMEELKTVCLPATVVQSEMREEDQTANPPLS